MTRHLNRRFTRWSGAHDIKIQGNVININLAKIVYRCEECHSKLRRRDFGLVCSTDPDHRGFIHRDRVAELQTEQEKLLDQVQQDFVIEDGMIKFTGDDLKC